VTSYAPRTSTAQQSRIQRLFSSSLASAEQSALLREVRGAFLHERFGLHGPDAPFFACR
jgi:hypothetical protein